MIIRAVKLVNFRSHSEYKLECVEETSQILGENGCGKTSVLEAIYEAMQGRSFRAVDREIVRRGCDFYRVELEYSDGSLVVVTYDAAADKKKFAVGDKNFARLPKKYKYPIVLFEPDDLNLVAASPARRRGYFDRMLAQLDEGYGVALRRYEKALKQRNELLKREFLRAEDVFSWNVLLAKYGDELRKSRSELVAKLNERLTEVYRSIAENGDEVGLSYDYEYGDYLAVLEAGYERDRAIGHTSYGAHRDNYEFWFNGVGADGSASRGEVRSMVIALKFIEAEMVLGRLGRRPVVLLDDVFSELDAVRQKCLVRNFKDHQVILTSVGGIEK